MKKPHLLLSAILIAGPAALYPATGLADAMTFPGSICRVFDPSKAGQLQAHHSGAINTSPLSDVVVTCPLTRDSTTDTNGASVVVKGTRDPSATTPFSCTLVSRDFNGGLLASDTKQSLATGPVTLGLSVGRSGVNGYYAVACTLPRKSILAGILLNE